MKFDEPKYRSLRRAYEQAVADGRTQFTWDGHELLTSYAYYLLEYVSSTLGIQK